MGRYTSIGIRKRAVPIIFGGEYSVVPTNYEIPAPAGAEVEAGSDDDAEVEAGSDDDAEVEANNEGANEDSFVGPSEVELEPDEDLPQGWITVTCEESGRRFYHHVAARHSQWERPTDVSDVSTVVGV